MLPAVFESAGVHTAVFVCVLCSVYYGMMAKGSTMAKWLEQQQGFIFSRGLFYGECE